MVVQMGGGTRNVLQAYQALAAQAEQERKRKLANIQGGVSGFMDAQAVGTFQDNLARMAQTPENQQPYGGGQPADGVFDPVTGKQTMSLDLPVAPTSPSLPPSALSQLDTGGFMGRLYGGLKGVGAYQDKMQPGMNLALLQDRNTRQDTLRGEEWARQDEQRGELWDRQDTRYDSENAREDSFRMDGLARQAAERQATAGAYGQAYDPNIPVSAYDNLARIKDTKDRRAAEAQAAEARNAATRDAMGLGDLDPNVDPQFYDNIGRMRQPGKVEPTLEEEAERARTMAQAGAEGRAAGTPAKASSATLSRMVGLAKDARKSYDSLNTPRKTGERPPHPNEVAAARRTWLVQEMSANLEAERTGQPIPFPETEMVMTTEEKAYILQVLDPEAR